MLTEFDVAATLRAKLGVELEPQLILGAYNPELAHQALQSDPQVGLLLPCNVVVHRYWRETVVAVLDPQLLATLTGRADPATVADKAGQRLDSMLAAVAAEGGPADTAGPKGDERR